MKYIDIDIRNEVANGADYNNDQLLETDANVVIFRFDPHPINFIFDVKAVKY